MPNEKELAATKIQAAWRGHITRDDPNKIFKYPQFYKSMSNLGVFQECPELGDPRPWYTGDYDGKTDSITLHRFVTWYPYLDQMIQSQLPLIPRGIEKLIRQGLLNRDEVNRVQCVQDNHNFKIPASHPFKKPWDLFCQKDKTELCEFLAENELSSLDNPNELIIYWTTNQSLSDEGFLSRSDACIEINLPKNAAFRIVSEGIDAFEQEWNTLGALPFKYISKITRNDKVLYERQAPSTDLSPRRATI